MCCGELEKNAETIVEIYPQWALLLVAPATFPSDIVVCWSWNAQNRKQNVRGKNAKVRQRTRKSTQRLAKVNNLIQFVIFPQTVCPQYHPHQHCHTFSDHYPPTPPAPGVSCRDKSSQDDLQNWRRIFSWRIWQATGKKKVAMKPSIIAWYDGITVRRYDIV